MLHAANPFIVQADTIRLLVNRLSPLFTRRCRIRSHHFWKTQDQIQCKRISFTKGSSYYSNSGTKKESWTEGQGIVSLATRRASEQSRFRGFVVGVNIGVGATVFEVIVVSDTCREGLEDKISSWYACD